MKLPDFALDQAFNLLRKKMDAEYVHWESNSWNNLNADELIQKLYSKEGLESENPLIYKQEDGTFEIHGQKALVYIRDWPRYSNRPIRERKYHIAYCETLKQMERDKRFHRYVLAKRDIPEFIVHILDEQSSAIIEKYENKKLDVCKRCLDALNYKGYSKKDWNGQKEVFNAFELSEFFEIYKSTKIINLPTKTDITAPIDIYPDDFDKISKSYRASKNWMCEDCGLNLESHKKFLHTHHLDSKSGNQHYNLRALCIKCHSKMPQHERLKFSPDYKKFEELSLMKN